MGDETNYIYALRGSDGMKLWDFRLGGQIMSSPAIGDVDNDGYIDIIIGTEDFDYKVYALKPISSGKRIYWQALSGDRYFNRTKNQYLIDKDNDMLSDYSELYIYHTLIGDSDSDDDGFLDGIEIYYSTNPLNPNSYPGDPSDNNISGYDMYYFFSVFFILSILTVLLYKKKLLNN